MGQILTHILIEFIVALGPDLGLSSGLGYDMSASTNEMALLSWMTTQRWHRSVVHVTVNAG